MNAHRILRQVRDNAENMIAAACSDLAVVTARGAGNSQGPSDGPDAPCMNHFVKSAYVLSGSFCEL